METFAILSAIFNIIGWAIYIYTQFSGITKSNSVGWLMSLLVVISSYVSTSINSNDWSVGLMYATGVFFALIVFLKCLSNGFKPSNREYVSLSFGVICLVASYFLPEISTFIIVIYLLLTYSVFSLSLAKGDTSEPVIPWGIWCIAAIFQIVSLYLKTLDYYLAILPITNLICWFTIFSLSVYKSIKLSNNNSLPKDL